MEEQREFSLISYKSNLFENASANSVPGDMATHQLSTSHENEIANNSRYISRLRNTIEERMREAPIQSRENIGWKQLRDCR